MRKLLTKRNQLTHKGDYGRVVIIGGSTGMHGSVVLTSMAAMRTGSGYTYLMVPNKLAETVSHHLCETIVIPIKANDKPCFTLDSIADVLLKLDNKDAIAIGMGMRQNQATTKLVLQLIKQVNKSLVIDADGINVLKNNLDYLKDKNNIVLTPHPGELATILDVSIKEVQANRLFYAKYLASKYNITVVLKGRATIVAYKDNEVYINDTGNAGMATAGSGDVLSGVIVALLGFGLHPFAAAKLGVYLHGYAGDLTANAIGEYGMIASDLILKMPLAINQYLSANIKELNEGLLIKDK